MDVLDAHWHQVVPDRLRYSWLAKAPDISEHATISHYLAECRLVGIGTSIHVEADPDDEDALAEVLLATPPGGPARAAVIKLSPESPEFVDRLRAAQRAGNICGVRRVLHMGAGHLLHSTAFRQGLHALAPSRLPFDLCVLPTQLSATIDLVQSCPHTRFILDHGALPNIAHGHFAPWAADIARLANLSNVVGVKISGLAECAGPAWTLLQLRPYLDHLREVFGPSRLIFATNWPVCLRATSLAAWLGAIREWSACWPVAEQVDLFAGNAKRLYHLS